MQCGFALLEAGSVRLKNTKNILLKNVVNTCLSALTWWAIGRHHLPWQHYLTCSTHVLLQLYCCDDACVISDHSPAACESMPSSQAC